MKKSILNFGKALNKAEQKSINGGERPILVEEGPCGETGGSIINHGPCSGYGYVLYQGQCWVCH